MAGRSGSQVMTMTVTSTPSADLAFTNLAYCSSSDLRQFSVPGSDLFLANLSRFREFEYQPSSIRDGNLALNAIQRRHARVSTGDMVSVSRFVPPENFELAMLTLELEFVKKGTKSEQVDAALLSTQLKRKYTNQKR
ncbi:hypothetical protein F2Q70_00002572 [Brassica cretica]|uniref:Vesicle-fusing ATPase n=1 Tax=Brassica cretica TaxID=69181 RepID=A0A8S9IQE9_BRACR|nr:hypothetical protein F2Q70_00002572 [Brassica cretica]